MKKNKILFVLWALCFFVIQTNAQTPLSFEESLHLLNQGNQSLKIADKGIEIAKAERDNINVISLRDVKRSHRTLTEEQVTDALDILTARNYLTMIPPNRAGRKKESYAINPSLLRQ